MKLQENYNFSLGLFIVLFLILMMVVSFVWTPYPPNQINASDKLLSFTPDHLLGTDNFGRDILSRIMEGSKTVFLVGISSVSIGLFWGMMIGLISGLSGGMVDEFLMRLMDAMMSIPGILFAIMLVSIFKPSLLMTIIALGVPRIPSFARIVRGGVLQVKELDFVKSSQIKGASIPHLVIHHILPNIRTQIVVVTTLSFSTVVLSEFGLSYLGLGVQPPHSSWGRMLNEAKPYLTSAPWYIFVVGFFITLVVLGFNLLGDGLRKRQDRRQV
ncbi:ABC transporter permease [Facklamia lactis]|uniref:ABC transporter permease n=1 Tax=Facklamia lactis TaxID=2749967 RepID=UPI0018CCF5EF|nr:ABC transporter permease [Facklamia lactis]MBG9981048.1 ABC transporter permease [Facklamia lactis]